MLNITVANYDCLAGNLAFGSPSSGYRFIVSGCSTSSMAVLFKDSLAVRAMLIVPVKRARKHLQIKYDDDRQ